MAGFTRVVDCVGVWCRGEVEGWCVWWRVCLCVHACVYMPDRETLAGRQAGRQAGSKARGGVLPGSWRRGDRETLAGRQEGRDKQRDRETERETDSQTCLEVGGAEAALEALVVQHLHLEGEVPLPQLQHAYTYSMEGWRDGVSVFSFFLCVKGRWSGMGVCSYTHARS